MCYGFTYVVHTLANWTHYVLAVITVMRAVVVVCPLRRGSLCNVRTALLSVVWVGATSVVKNIHWLWSVDFTFDPRTHAMQCSLGVTRRTPLVMFLIWFEMVVSSVAPFLLICCANVGIVRALRGKPSEKKPSLHLPSSVIKKREKAEKNLTVIVLVVSLCFLVLACPMLVNDVYSYTLGDMLSPHTQASLFLSWHVCQKLWYTNNAINFYVYALFGKEFRGELCKVMKRPLMMAGSRIMVECSLTSEAAAVEDRCRSPTCKVETSF